MDSGDVRERHLQALKLGFDGDDNASLLALEVLTFEFPEDTYIRFDFAMMQMMLGNFEDACKNLKIVLQIDPNHIRAIQQVTYC